MGDVGCGTVEVNGAKLCDEVLDEAAMPGIKMLELMPEEGATDDEGGLTEEGMSRLCMSAAAVTR